MGTRAHSALSSLLPLILAAEHPDDNRPKVYFLSVERLNTIRYQRRERALLWERPHQNTYVLKGRRACGWARVRIAERNKRNVSSRLGDSFSIAFLLPPVASSPCPARAGEDPHTLVPWERLFSTVRIRLRSRPAPYPDPWQWPSGGLFR